MQEFIDVLGRLCIFIVAYGIVLGAIIIFWKGRQRSGRDE